MISKNSVAGEDMLRIAKILPYRSPSEVPLRFLYGERVVCGIPDDFCPRVTVRRPDANTVQIVIVGQDAQGLEIRCEYLEYLDFPMTEWVFFFTNRGEGDTEPLSDIRIAGHLDAPAPVLHHGNGDTCGRDGYTWYDDPIDRTVSLGTRDGTPCNGAFPYFRLRDGGDGGYQIALGWPGSWRAEFSPDEGGVHFEMGQWRCHFAVRPGETMRTPRLNLMAYCGDDSRACNMWRRWYFAHILPRENGHPLRPMLCLHTYRIGGKEEFCGITEKNQIDAIQTYVDRGMRPDIWWVDAGWYACGDVWWKLGDWHPNRENLPNGFAPIGEKCDENGIRLLVWFEPERCYEGGLLLQEHPEWFLHWDEPDGTPSKNYAFDLGNPEARQYITDYVSGMIAQSHIRVYRQDFNFSPMHAWMAHEAPDRIGAMENLHVQGYLQYWDDLLLRNPGLWIDSCASGGRRNDLETMRRAVPLQYTDVGLGEHPAKQKQHRQMFEWIPYFRAHTMSHDDDEGNYLTGGYQKVDAFAYHNAMAPVVTSMIEYNDDDAMFDMGRKMTEIWRRAAQIELSGDYYPLTECRLNPADYYAMQFDRPECSDGFFQVIRNTKAQEDTFTVHLTALDDETVYRLSDPEHGETRRCTGRELREGFSVSIPKRSGILWFYRAESEDTQA